jgi:hypothetical protein
MQFIRDLFSESGNVSMTRFLSLLCVLMATIIAIYGLIEKSDIGQLSMLCATFLGTGMGGKVAQKWVEKNSTTNVE